MFELDERLQQDSFLLGYFPLSVLLMSKDANYPWFILVPQRAGVSELYQLNSADLSQLMLESIELSRAITAVFAGVKLNVAALGNMVAQLHVHHIVRFEDDPAWPAPVWGACPPRAYAPEEKRSRIDRVRKVLGEGFTSASAEV
jgi:diadenosine tetraphosphate (Ap4A) HIT family hydrolase